MLLFEATFPLSPMADKQAGIDMFFFFSGLGGSGFLSSGFRSHAEVMLRGGRLRA